MAILGFAGVAAGAYIVIQSIIVLSTIFHISEYFISFFAAAIGTSLPESAVDFNAIRKREYDLAIGDIIGSSIVDASLSMELDHYFFQV
jgi:cation:H+ antiporter